MTTITERLITKWESLTAYGIRHFQRIMFAIYALERHTRPSGNPRSYRIEDLTEDQANEFLKAIQQQELELEATPSPGRQLK